MQNLPSKADLSDRMPPVFDQGELGSSTACAMAAAVAADQTRPRRYACHCSPNFWAKDPQPGDTEFGSSDLAFRAMKMAEAMIKHPEARKCWMVDRQTGQTLDTFEKPR